MIREVQDWLRGQGDLSRATSTAAAAAQGVSLGVFQSVLRERGAKYMDLVQEERVRRIQTALEAGGSPTMADLARQAGVRNAHTFSSWYRYTFGESWRKALANNRVGRKMK